MNDGRSRCRTDAPISSSEAAAFLAPRLCAQLEVPLGQRCQIHLLARHPDARCHEQVESLAVCLDVQIGGVDLQVACSAAPQSQLVLAHQAFGSAQKRVLIGVDRVDHQIQRCRASALKLQLLDVKIRDSLPFIATQI